MARPLNTSQHNRAYTLRETSTSICWWYGKSDQYEPARPLLVSKPELRYVHAYLLLYGKDDSCIGIAWQNTIHKHEIFETANGVTSYFTPFIGLFTTISTACMLQPTTSSLTCSARYWPESSSCFTPINHYRAFLSWIAGHR
jgi:hypothetical protein